MTNQQIIDKLKLIKEALGNENITLDEGVELVTDMICDMEECESPFSLNISDDDTYYESFEETDFTKMDTENTI